MNQKKEHDIIKMHSNYHVLAFPDGIFDFIICFCIYRKHAKCPRYLN
jgi:hypothetical protein